MANVCEQELDYAGYARAQRTRMYKSEFYTSTAYTREHAAKVTRSYDSRIRRGTSSLPATEIICGRRATINRAAAPDIRHAYSYALFQVYVIVCLWSWVVCAWELDRQPPRSATTKEELACRMYVRIYEKLRFRVEHEVRVASC